MSEGERTFEHALTLEDDTPSGAFHARVTPDWAQGRSAYGGLVAALMARALERRLPPARSLRSALIDFVAPIAPGPVTVVPSVLRTGRALTHGEARLLQDGEVRATLVAAYGEPRATSLQVNAADAPALAPPETLLRMPYIDGMTPRFTKNFELRMPEENVPFTGAQHARIQGYMRHHGGGPVDAPGLLGLLDAWPPALTPRLKRFSPVSTVTWMVDLVGPSPERGAHSDAFFRYDAVTVAADGGYASCEARLWGPDGRLAAASRQMVAEFS